MISRSRAERGLDGRGEPKFGEPNKLGENILSGETAMSWNSRTEPSSIVPGSGEGRGIGINASDTARCLRLESLLLGGSRDGDRVRIDGKLPSTGDGPSSMLFRDWRRCPSSTSRLSAGRGAGAHIAPFKSPPPTKALALDQLGSGVDIGSDPRVARDSSVRVPPVWLLIADSDSGVNSVGSGTDAGSKLRHIMNASGGLATRL